MTCLGSPSKRFRMAMAAARMVGRRLTSRTSAPDACTASRSWASRDTARSAVSSAWPACIVWWMASRRCVMAWIFKTRFAITGM